MKIVRNGFIKNIRYLCLVRVFALGFMITIGTIGCCGDGDDNGSIIPPELRSPINNTSITDTTPTLEWYSNGAVEYEVVLDDSSSFSSPIIDKTVTELSYTLSQDEALIEGTYYWRVQGKSSDGNWSGWSLTFSFTIVSAGTDLQPTALIDSPPSNTTITEVIALPFLGSVASGNAPFTYYWDFDGGAPDSTSKDPGSVIFSTTGEFIVTFTVTDADNDTSSASVVIIVEPIDGNPV